MVNVKDAVRKATEFVADLYPTATDIRLEEVEPFSQEWRVVVSFRDGDPSGLRYVLGNDQRIFKTISIDSEDGAPLSLKVFKL